MSKFYYSIAVMLFTLVVCSSDGYYANGAGPDTNRYVRKPYDTAITLKHATGIAGLIIQVDSSSAADQSIIYFKNGAGATRAYIVYTPNNNNLTISSLLDTLYLGNGIGPVYINNVKALQVTADTAAFTTTADRKAVYIAGALSTDIYVITPRFLSETLPATGDALGYTAKADSLIVTRASGVLGTSGLKFSWLRTR